MRGHESWMLIAQEDLASAKLLCSASFTTTLFHIQQSAEKALKSYLIAKRGLFIKKHDLEFLVDACMVVNKDFEELRLIATVLSPYEVVGRYPDVSFIKPSQDKMYELIDQARYLISRVQDYLENKGRNAD